MTAQPQLATPLAASAAVLPDGLALGPVRLRVRDRERSLAFYTGVIGLADLGGTDGVLRLGAGGRVLIELEVAPDAPPARRGDTGLFHVAILVPDRAALAAVVQRFVRLGARFGASDHLVSEALYIDDPDGNGLEIYRDRSRDEWEWQGTSIHMETLQLDLRSVLKDLPPGTPVETPMPSGTTIGHVHLKVGDLETARRFYVERLGFALTTDRYSGALFVAAGGYHHHLGLNVWESRGRGPAAAGRTGLVHYRIDLPDAAAVEALRARLVEVGEAPATIPGGFAIRDPWGTTAHVVAQG
ncbi:VOC family protein [Ancylobacter terrae]|uniref:VOC family protein n=1 Tax=Ancylobacter sp. sgz301288 TaxID=3342077 RepID=UPI00385DF746